jgi:hypothetical protein
MKTDFGTHEILSRREAAVSLMNTQKPKSGGKHGQV